MSLDKKGSTIVDYRQYLKRYVARSCPYETSSGTTPALDPRPSLTPSFVAPPIEQVDGDTGANAVLIQAAGAVGKSTLAAALSRDLGWPLVHAEKAQVGSYSLSGLIHGAFGFESDFLQQFAAGDVGLVVDALDEAHLRAGTPNFLAFLENVRDLALSTRGGSRNLILLSRSETAQLIRLSFQEGSVPLEVDQIDLFARNSANALIDKYLEARYDETRKAGYNVARAFPAPFERLRDLRLKQLGGVLLSQKGFDLTTDWNRAREFLGYAPVLIAVSESLAVSNPSKEYSANLNATSTPWALIADIVNRIMVREQGKFMQSMHDVLAAHNPIENDDLPSAFYTPREQAIRLLCLLQGRSSPVLPPSTLPTELREIYEASAMQFTADHPFLRDRVAASPVFSDYVHAQCSIGLDSEMALGAAHVPGATEVGPFYLGFLIGVLGDSLTVPERLIPSVLRSWERHASVAPTQSETANVFLWDEGGLVHLPGEMGSWQAESEGVTLQVDNLTGAIHLDGLPAKTFLHTSSGVILGSPGRPLVLRGPMMISARDMEICSESLSFIGTSDGRDGWLMAEEMVANGLTATDCHPPLSLAVMGELIPAKLESLRQAPPSGDGLLLLGHSDFVALRAILTAFRRTVHMGLSAPAHIVGKIVGHEAFRRAIISELEARGIVRDLGDWLVLETSALAKVGFSLADLKKGEPTPDVVKFLAACRSSLP